MQAAPSPSDFMLSSQAAAIQPVTNGSYGPQLARDFSFPLPTYKTSYPIQLNQGLQTISIRFLAKSVTGVQVQLKNCNVAATAPALLEFVQPEVYQIMLSVSPLSSGIGSTQLELTEFGKPLCYVIVQFAFGAQDFSLGVSQTLGSGQSNLYSPMQASVLGSQWRQSQRLNSTSPAYYQPQQSANNYTSQQYATLASPARYHSQYCYDGKDIPVEVAEQARMSNLAFSQSGDKEPDQRQVAPSAERFAEKIAEVSSKEEKPEHNTETQSAAVESNVQAPELREHEEKVEAESEEAINEEVDFEQNEQLHQSDLQQPVAHSSDKKPQAQSPFKLVPSALLLPPTSHGSPQVAIIRIKNTEETSINLQLQIAPRSFNTSTANCEFQQLAPGCASFSIAQAELSIVSGGFRDIEVRFNPEQNEYILHAAKLLIAVAGKSYQVPLLGISGVPDISAHGSQDSREIRLRNDGDGVGVVTAGAQSWILQPGASQVIESGERKFKVMHDGLRMLGEHEWKEMLNVMGMTGIDEQVERLIGLTCIEIEVEE